MIYLRNSNNDWAVKSLFFCRNKSYYILVTKDQIQNAHFIIFESHQQMSRKEKQSHFFVPRLTG